MVNILNKEDAQSLLEYLGKIKDYEKSQIRSDNILLHQIWAIIIITAGIFDYIYVPARIAILLFLMPRSHSKFVTIQKTLGVTPGNLSSYLKKLEKSHFIDIKKIFVDGKPTTIVYLTTDGYNGIIQYAQILNKALSERFG